MTTPYTSSVGIVYWSVAVPLDIRVSSLVPQMQIHLLYTRWTSFQIVTEYCMYFENKLSRKVLYIYSTKLNTFTFN